MNMANLLALDQGASSSRSVVFDENGRVGSLVQQEPRPFPTAAACWQPSPGSSKTDRLTTHLKAVFLPPARQFSVAARRTWIDQIRSGKTQRNRNPPGQCGW